jgi:hypothetical protein
MNFPKIMSARAFTFKYQLNGFGGYFEFDFTLVSGNEENVFELLRVGPGKVHLTNRVEIKGPKRFELVFQADAKYATGVVLSRYVTKFIIIINEHNFGV